MLKVIAFENFVHFEDKQVINFETAKPKKKAARGISHGKNKNEKETSADTKKTTQEISEKTETKNKLNFFVGANFCGKSTVLELIRRCMTNEINVSVTRSFNENKVAYVFCKFDLNSKEVISGVIKEGNKCSRFHKVLIYNINDVGKVLRCDTFESSESPPSVSFRRFADPGEAGDEDVLKHIFDKKKKEFTYINNILNKIQPKKKENELNLKLPELHWRKLEETYVATMPLRGIGTVQWTKSEKIKPKDTDKDKNKQKYQDNYKMACERAEIISELLSEGSNVVNENYVDANQEKKIFDHLTYPEKFIFEKTGDKINVQHGSFDPFPLLKTSEGILEAKQVSLLLAHRDFQTICLEEPDRGMHAQMIERLRAILYQEGLNKTIIVSTHSRYFIDTSTINNTHVFFRTESNVRNYSCNVKNVALQKDLPKVSDVETLRNLLFATKVLLVEGPTDRDVVQALFTNLRESRQEEIGKEKESDISAFQIIPIGGCQSAKNVIKFCKYINLPFLCLLDLDKFVSIEKRSPTQKVIKDFPQVGKNMVDWLKKEYVGKSVSCFLDNGFNKLSDHLRKKKIFIWKHGALEDAILSSEDMNTKIAESLNISLSDTTTRCEKLKSKLKQRLDEKERRSFSKHLSEVNEIKLFLDFMRDEENKRIQGSNVSSDSEYSFISWMYSEDA